MPQDIIERQFESSFLKRIRYSGEGQLLIVEFKTGEIYQYSAVPDWRVHELLGASSIGSYFSTHIAKTYSFVRLPKFPCNDTLSSGQTTVKSEGEQRTEPASEPLHPGKSLPDPLTYESGNSGQKTAKLERKQTVEPTCEQTPSFMPTPARSQRDILRENSQAEQQAQWAAEDQKRTAFMRKMKWSEARMARYERHCKDPTDGCVGFLWFWLFLVASAIIYWNFFAPTHSSKETVEFLILFVAFAPYGLGLLSALFTWLRKSYYHRFLGLPVFLPSDRSSIEAGWEAERQKAKDDADYRIRKDAENAERRRELAKQWTEERQRQWLSTPPENWTPYKEVSQIVPVQQATPPRPIKPLLVPLAPPRAFPIIPTVTTADIQEQEQLHPSPSTATAPTELESALTANLPAVESPSIVEVPTKKRLLPILTGQTPAPPVQPSQAGRIDPLESEGPETSPPAQELPSAAWMLTEAAPERPPKPVQGFFAFTTDERQDPESTSLQEGAFPPEDQEAPMPSPAREGQRKLRTNYEAVRSPKLREAAIQIHGRSCTVCGFNFDEFFGKDLARGYIEVHHLDNIAAGERFTDPAKDLAPLCANCHAMADRLTADLDSPPRSIAELRTLLIPKHLIAQQQSEAESRGIEG